MFPPLWDDIPLRMWFVTMISSLRDKSRERYSGKKEWHSFGDCTLIICILMNHWKKVKKRI
jgi:hypothetical protein